jgi:hypothetical protein
MGNEWFTHGKEYDFGKKILRKCIIREARHRLESNIKTNLKKIGWNFMESFYMTRNMKNIMGTCGSKSKFSGV